MNDNELSTMVRESVADVHSGTPVAQIISRGRAARARRRLSGVAGVAVVAAGTSLAVVALAPSGHHGLPGQHHPGLASSGRHRPNPAASAQLAAWTVAKQPDGDIDVTINQLKNPAGLQRTLRADGLPANVTFSGSVLDPACQPDFASMKTLDAVARYNTSDGSAFLVINPSALPSGTGVGIFDEPGTRVPLPSPSPGVRQHGPATLDIPAPSGYSSGPLAVALVYASQSCTG
jgi:type 1 fimbria pilin